MGNIIGSPTGRLILTALVLAAAVFYIFPRAESGTQLGLTLTSQPVLEDGLLLHWTMDGKDIDGSQATAEVRDRSGNGRHGDAIFPASGGAISMSRIQSATHDGDPASATFGATPTEGNLLVVVATQRAGTSHSAHTISGSGWTKQIGRDTLLADSGSRRNMAVWTKVAGESEPTNIQVDDGTANTKRIQISEFTTALANPTWTFQATSSADTGGTDTSPLSTGSTESVADGDLFVLGAAIWRNGEFAPGGISWTNGLVDIVDDLGGENGRSISTAWVYDTSGGAKESEVSWTGNASKASAGIMVFSVEGGGGGGAATVIPGAIGQALDFDGVDDHVAGGDIDGGVAPRTVSFWMKAATTTASHSLVHLDYSNADYITTDSSSNITANGFTADAIYVDGSSASANIPNTDWHHVVVILPSGLAADDFSIASTTSSVGLFGGAIDDVRVYSKVLSADEVSRLYALGGTTKLNTTVNTQPTLETGLVGHWTFDGPDVDLSQNTAEVRDSSGQGNHGDWRNHASTTRPGRIGQALEFDGTDDYIDVGDEEELIGTNFTYTLWFRAANIAGDLRTLISKIQGSSPCDGLLISQQDANMVVFVDSCTSQIDNSNYVVANEWIFLSVTLDNGTVRLYKNGAQVAKNGYTSVTANDRVFLIGRQNNDEIRYFNGVIDDVRVYNRALSQDEITRLYKLGATAKLNTTINTQPTLETGLVGHWTFDGQDVDLSQNTAEVRDRAGALHGDWRGHASTTRAGRIGQGIDFDGTNDDVNVGNAGSGIKTISFWMRADDNTSRKIINIDGTDQIELDGSGIVTATSFPGTTVVYVDNSSASAQTSVGQWHHVVITDTTGVSGSTFVIGAVSSSYFDGMIDDVRVYDRVLSADEITRLYKLGR